MSSFILLWKQLLVVVVFLFSHCPGLLVHGFLVSSSSSWSLSSFILSWPTTYSNQLHPSLTVASKVISASANTVLPQSKLHAINQRKSNADVVVDREEVDFFKAGLLANKEEEAAQLASKKIRSLTNLGFSKVTKNQKQRRSSSIRPKYWAWGGADERAIQDKPNYDPINNPDYCPEPWVSLPDFYTLVGDDTAVADTIFVALAGGRAFVERDVAEQVLQQWYGNKNSGSGGGGATFNKDAFLQTVRRGQQDFLWGWGSFLSITGLALVGIVFPTNPLQIALVHALDVVVGGGKPLVV
jgi:hypothetical protein